jgi:branched-chain amino acid aminotransferase
VIDLCKLNDIPVYEKNFSIYEAVSADEAFLPGTFGAQTPVIQIDGKDIGEGKGAGPITRKIRELYTEMAYS